MKYHEAHFILHLCADREGHLSILHKEKWLWVSTDQQYRRIFKIFDRIFNSFESLTDVNSAQVEARKLHFIQRRKF